MVDVDNPTIQNSSKNNFSLFCHLKQNLFCNKIYSPREHYDSPKLYMYKNSQINFHILN